MSPAFSRYLIACLAISALVGCATPAALRRQTVNQGETVTDIHQQQVLDNLAKFIVDPYSVPSFALAASGAVNVDDQCNGALGLNWMATGFDSAALSLGGQRSQGTSWVTTPITDPRKLELMRCAYQRVLTRCGIMPVESTSCPDCTKRFNKFYTGHAFGSQTDNSGDTCYECEGDQLSNLVSPPLDDACVCQDCECPQTTGVPDIEKCDCKSPGDGIVNSECLSCENGNWFCWSRNHKCVPSDCSCVGHYCGLYVWVPCGPSRDELAKLTLVILDYAVNDDAELPSKEIEAYLDCQLQPTTADRAYYKVTTLVGLDESTNTVHMGDAIEKKCDSDSEQIKTGAKKQNLRGGPGAPSIPNARPIRRRSPMPGASIPFEQQLLNTL